MESKKMHVLQVIRNLTYDGINTYLINYYRRMKQSNVHFDFVVHGDIDTRICKNFESMGGRIYMHTPFTLSHLSKILRETKELFQLERKYDAVHCHMANAAFLYFLIAKKYGVKCCILHSHNNKAGATWSCAMRNYPLLYLGNKFATHRVACTYDAGRFLFGNNRFTVIKNAIDVDKFIFDAAVRERIRDSLSLQDKFIIGHIGRLDPQKNQMFLLDVFAELLPYKENAVLMLVGDGNDRKKIEEKIHALHLEDKVMLLGVRSDPEKYYQAFDVFVFPSEYEGLGIVLIEAQTAGLPCLASADIIPQDAKVSNLLKFIPLSAGAKHWAKEILSMPCGERVSPVRRIEESGYSITKEAIKLEKYYRDILCE